MSAPASIASQISAIYPTVYVYDGHYHAMSGLVMEWVKMLNGRRKEIPTGRWYRCGAKESFGDQWNQDRWLLDFAHDSGIPPCPGCFNVANTPSDLGE